MNTPRNCETCNRARQFIVDCLVALCITIVCLGSALLTGCGHYRVSGAFEYASKDAPETLPVPVTRPAHAASGVRQ